ncbi:ABC transporter permease [Rubritalea sp.]|uniref:ABC transporter permease n=1 Tax=Rubritalea sp. TaxID=2109375 RepID=UPI003EFA6B72
MSDTIKIDPVVEKVTDFSDKMNPMLVKELRQGLRGVGFLILFLALQALMMLVMIGYGFAASYDNSGESLSTSIFIFFALAVLVVQPLRGMNTIASEMKNKTIDLMVLTNLSAWRIVYGKWISLVSQSALIFVTLMPYMIMRYFFGGMHLFAEITLFIFLFLTSMVVTAVAVGISAIPSMILRGIVAVIGLCFMIPYAVFGVAMGGYENLVEIFTIYDKDVIYALIAYIASCVFVTWLSLDFGASVIAPLAENRSTARKLIGFGAIVITGILILRVDEQAAILISLLLLIPLSIIALSEHCYLVPQVCVPFVKRGVAGKILGRILYPGWATAVIYVGLLFVWIQVLNIIAGNEFSDDQFHAFVVNTFAVLLFPLVICRFFFRKLVNLIGHYLIALIFSGVLALVIYIIAESTDQKTILMFFFWIPMVNYFGIEEIRGQRETYVILSYVLTAVYAVISLLLARPVWRHIRESEKSAEHLLSSDEPK